MEVELKLLINANDVAALRAHPLLKEFARTAPRDQVMHDLYFDTPELQLRTAGAGLRVRRVGDEWIQTLKAGGSVAGGLHSRHEWETRVAGPVPDLALLRALVDRKSAWGQLLRTPGCEEQLLPIFSTQVTRTIWDLQLAGGDDIECVLDIGFLERDGQRIPVSEIELELKTGDPLHLFDVALALQQDVALQISNLSKADRGYALYVPQPVAAVKAQALVLHRQMTIVQAFQVIAANCLAQVQGNEAGVVHRLDTESLHQMRVGLRRLRCALDLFRGLQPLPAPLQADLDWLMEQLGAARDWDVLVGTTLPAVAAAARGEVRLAGLGLAALVHSREKHAAAAAAVGSPRTTRLMLGLARWLLVVGAQPDHLMKRLPGYSRGLLEHHQQRLRRRGKQLDESSAQARHRLRIAVKKMRYAIEFFSALYPAKKMRRYAEGLAMLQDQLGSSNDAAVADRLLRQLQDGPLELACSAGFVRGFLSAGAAIDDRLMREQARRFGAKKIPG
ncbi:CHAD domain-containing protein [Actimicrobium sp. CCC2.4]|uniref:CYTH and CHAD domain-containing protein n=1 Tax=Actimicrobium sp. CCC2.4 TaxID=3048606 RepID=UPI002AC8C3CF|nr:CHAD domain-containing protein [Actimicrobium sp. CCC2.4]MEB0136707.1 CHAD domain-containing protein [Actimicrobium sp. CCC2.4]WPX33172.1 CHAD domain-containing protein [Actimicrobium sp. CCC2.4]